MIAAAAGGASVGVSAGLDHAIAAFWVDVGGVPKNSGGDDVFYHGNHGEKHGKNHRFMMVYYCLCLFKMI